MLSYILAGISSRPGLQNVLVFKGGAALKKLFFGEYRFSEHLDLSGANSPKGEKLEKALQETVEETHHLLSLHGPFSIQLERYLERDPLIPLGKKRSSYAYNSLGILGRSVESNWKSLTMNQSCRSQRNVG